MLVALLTFIFNDAIFGVKTVDESGVVTWNPEPFFSIGADNIKVPLFRYLYEHAIPNILKTFQIAAVAITFAIGLHYLTKIVFVGKKAKTVSRLVLSFIKWVIFLCALFFTLDAWGADTTTMLASAGVLTLIIGLGSQSLIADILAGIFIVFEGDYQVGDIVVLDGWRGEIQSIGVRTTKLIDAGYNVKIINNSEIKTIINQSKELSLAKCYVSTRYEDRIENIEAIIADNLANIKEKIPAIVEGPYYKGVSELAESSVDLLFVAKCKEEDIYQVQRDLNREIKIMFDNNGIGIPFPQVVIHKGEDDEPQKVSAKTAKKAQEFTEEQKELSKDINVVK